MKLSDLNRSFANLSIFLIADIIEKRFITETLEPNADLSYIRFYLTISLKR